MRIQLVGVIGCGVIGGSLAQDLAQTGHDVILVDTSEEALEQYKAGFISTARLQKLFSNAPSTGDPHQALGRITFTRDPQHLASAQFVIENVTEKWEIKKAVFEELDVICNDECVFASNTSAIPIAKLSGVTHRPDRVIGIHFMNPVPMKPMVELIRGPKTSDETAEITKQLLTQMNKEWVPVNDSPGFVSNRVLMLTINEAIAVAEEDVASPQDIDRVFKSCFNHKMGPLETADLIGLDTILLSLNVLCDHLDSARFEPCALLRRMVAEGNLGRKTGKGFYEYTNA